MKERDPKLPFFSICDYSPHLEHFYNTSEDCQVALLGYPD
jgi:hypothetical protein